jgi:hypothetical protein
MTMKTDLQGAIDIASFERRFEQLRRDGWALFPGAASNDLIAAATHAIARDCAHNYDRARQVEYDNLSFCPDLRDKPPIDELLTRSSARILLDLLLGWDKIAYAPDKSRSDRPTTLTNPIPRCRTSTASATASTVFRLEVRSQISLLLSACS